MVLVLCSGCASYMTARASNTQRRVVQLQAHGDGAVLGVDLSAIGAGYFAAWSDAPVTMLGATAIDALAIFGADRLIKEYMDKNDGPDQPEQPDYAIDSNGGDIVIINNGGTVEENRQWDNTFK